MAIEQQMEMFGANPMGGLDDDGLSRDPVSGNEIPPGSMANEVRDDVDAKLSDGEYVVPANVVRFFGVKFFEELRTQAMQGLGAMEANGRIGGEPVPSDLPMQDQMAQMQPAVSEEEMQMLQGLMNEGGYVRGYENGGDVVPETPEVEEPFDYENPPNYPFNPTPFATVGSSFFSPYNPNVTPDPNLPPTTTPVDPNPESGISFVTMVNPATGEIQIVQFKGGNPVDEAAYNNLLSNGFYVQGSDALAMAKQEASRGPEDDYDITTGSKPFNKMTVGELAWTMSRQSYNGAFPDSLSAGAANLFGKSLISKGVGSLLGNIPSELEIAISTAEKRLANDQFSNAKEKTMLEAMAALKGKPAKTVYKAMYDLTGVHLGASGKGFKRDIRVKDFSTTAAQKNAARLIKETKEEPASDDVKTALIDDGSDYGVDPVGKPYTKRDGTKTADYTQSKEYKDQVDRAKKAQSDADGDRDSENRQEIEALQQKESVVGSDEDIAADREMNKGGIIKKRKKKK